MFDTSNVISAELVKGRKHKVTLHVPVRPEDSNLYLTYYTSIAEGFCKEYDCKFAGGLDVAFNKMNEGAILVFLVKEFKANKKRRRNSFIWD